MSADRSGATGVGVIGAGIISSTYLEHLTAAADLEVHAVADLDVERAQAQAARHGVAAGVSVGDLLADERIEIVVNLTVPAAHVEIGMRALGAGKHVWGEKPLALDRAEARTLLERAEELGLRVASAPDTFLGAGLQTAQRLVEEGRIGIPISALALFRSAGPESWHPNPEFFYRRGGGPLFDMGPYYLTALVQLLGPVRRVTARSSTFPLRRVIGAGPRAGTEFAVEVPSAHSALVEFSSGASAQVVFSFESFRDQAPVLEIDGTTGAIALPDPNGFDGATRLWTDDPAQPIDIPAAGHVTGRGAGVVDLARSLRAGVPERASGRLAFHILDIMESIRESAELDRPIDLTSTTDRPATLPLDWDPTRPV